MRRATAVTLLALGLGACSLAISVDGLTGGGADAGGPDGAGPLEGGADAAADRATPDAGPSADADADAALQSPCATSHVFCTDFEEPDPRAKWDDVSTSSLCTVRAGAFECTAAVGQSDAVIWRRGLSFPKGSGFRIELDLAITAPTSTSGYEIDPLTLDTAGGPGTSAYLTIPIYNSRVVYEYARKLSDGGITYPALDLPLDRTGGWHHVAMTTRPAIGGQSASSSIAVDGVVVGAHLLDLSGGMPGATLRIGLAYLSAAPSATVRIDNVVVDEL